MSPDSFVILMTFADYRAKWPRLPTSSIGIVASLSYQMPLERHKVSVASYIPSEDAAHKGASQQKVTSLTNEANRIESHF